MKNLFNKIPLLFWAVILSGIAFFLVENNFLIAFTQQQTDIFSGLLTFIGLIFVAINIQQQWKNERIQTEYLNQPDFLLTGFSKEEFEGSGPVLCPNPEQCIKDHWFDIIQTGNLSARDLKVSLLFSTEAETNIDIKNRWQSDVRLSKGDTFQYKLPQYEIPFKYFDKSNDMTFYLLLDYHSEYSGIRYKRVYQLWASATPEPKKTKENDWKGRIYFYDSALANTNDTHSITIRETLLNKWLQFARWSKLKKDYTFEEWLINI